MASAAFQGRLSAACQLYFHLLQLVRHRCIVRPLLHSVTSEVLVMHHYSVTKYNTVFHIL